MTAIPASLSMRLCTPGMGVNLWGESPLYENFNVFIAMDTNRSRAEGKGVSARRGLKEAGVQRCETTNRNRI
jgi:hypothetical protein